MIAVERFMTALDNYVGAKINAAKDDSTMSTVQRNLAVSTAKQTMINELRLLLSSAQEDRSPSPYHRAADWRR